MIQKRQKPDWRRIQRAALFFAVFALCSLLATGGALPLSGAVAKSKTRAKVAKPVRKTATKASESNSKTTERPTVSNLRDPFKIPAEPEAGPGQISNGGGIPITGPLPPGSKGLIIDQVKLEGIVSQPKGNPQMIAVLANSANRAFFLHENDSLFDGVITKITSDSVYFRQDYRDAEGKMGSREVIKKMPPASGVKP